MEPTSILSPVAISAFDRVPNEVVFLLGKFLDRSALFNSVLVCHVWYSTLLPLLWAKIDLRQWHRPSFPLLRLLHLSHVLRVHQFADHGSYSSFVVKSLLCQVQQLEWWCNREMIKAHDRSRSGYVHTRFKSALSMSAKAAKARGDQSIEAPDWNFDGQSYVDASNILRSIPKQRLNQLLLQELPNLTPLSLRLGPFEEADFLVSLVHLPRSMKNLRLVSFDLWRPRVALEDLFPLFSRLEELELKGYWFYYKRDHPRYPSEASGSKPSALSTRRFDNAEQTPSSRHAWKLKRLAVKVDGLLLAQYCPKLVEFHLDCDESPEKLRLMKSATISLSFKSLEACKGHLKFLNVSQTTVNCPEIRDRVDTWMRFEYLTDLNCVVQDANMMWFLCEQRRIPLVHRPLSSSQDGTGDEFSQESEIDYPHVFLPHLQHLAIDYRQCVFGKGQLAMISHCVYWILMTRSKLLTFKAPYIHLDPQLIAPQELLNVKASNNRNRVSGGGNNMKTIVPSITPPPLWPSTALLRERILNKDVTWFENDVKGRDSVFLTARPIRFWACTRLETLDIRVKYRDLDAWRPLYRQLGELFELKSLSLVSSHLEVGADSGICQLADGLSEVDAVDVIEQGDDNVMNHPQQEASHVKVETNLPEPHLANVPSCIKGTGDDHHSLHRQPFGPRLTKLRHLVLRGDAPSQWQRDEIRRLLLLLPGLEQVRLKPLLPDSFKGVVQWLSEFGGVSSQTSVTPHSGGRRVPVKFL